MSDFGQLTNVHWESIALAENKGRCNCAKIFAFVVKNKGAALHGGVKFSEKFVT